MPKILQSSFSLVVQNVYQIAGFLTEILLIYVQVAGIASKPSHNSLAVATGKRQP